MSKSKNRTDKIQFSTPDSLFLLLSAVIEEYNSIGYKLHSSLIVQDTCILIFEREES